MTDFKRRINKLLGKDNDYLENEENAIEKGDILNLPCDRIRPNRAQPRADFNGDELFRLADSIKRYGIIQPLTVRKADIDDIYDYELIAGERRLRAARLLELYCVPCIVINADEQISAELAIVENLMRKDLNMFETAFALRNLCEDHGLTQEEVARRLSMSQSAVANKMRLLRLSYEEQQIILSLSLTERHARALLRLDDREERLRAIRHFSDFDLNVKEAERYVDLLVRGRSSTKSEPAPPTFDKSASSVIRGIQKRLDNLSRLGRHASMEVEDKGGAIELHIRIEKEPDGDKTEEKE